MLSPLVEIVGTQKTFVFGYHLMKKSAQGSFKQLDKSFIVPKCPEYGQVCILSFCKGLRLALRMDLFSLLECLQFVRQGPAEFLQQF